MLATLSFLMSLSLTHAATKIIYSSDPAIDFSPGWSQEYSQISQDSYMQTDSFPSSLTATLPNSASSVSFVAYKRARESVYGYCLDCDGAAEATLLTVDGSDPSVTNDSMALESTLFFMDIDPSTQHTLTVYNLPSSEITFDHLNVEVEDGDADTATLSGQSQGPTPTASASSFSSTPLTQSRVVSSALTSNGAASSTGKSVPTSATPGESLTTIAASSTTIPILQHPVSSSATSTSSSAPSSAASPSSSAAPDEATTGLSKSLITGISILAVVLAASILVGLFVFMRKRRQRRRDSFQSSDSQPSQTLRGSLIPIMPPPPQMRTASLNPFSDPPFQNGPELPLDSPINSSLMQRRMDRTPASPGSAPTIPLPDLPLDRPAIRMESRSNSPASTFSRNDLWITRPVQTPVNAQFSPV